MENTSLSKGWKDVGGLAYNNFEDTGYWNAGETHEDPRALLQCRKLPMLFPVGKMKRWVSFMIGDYLCYRYFILIFSIYYITKENILSPSLKVILRKILSLEYFLVLLKNNFLASSNAKMFQISFFSFLLQALLKNCLFSNYSAS